MTTALIVGAIIVLAILGARLFVIVGVLTMLCFVLIAEEGTEMLVSVVNKMENLTTKNVFLAIPCFIAAGNVMTRGGMAERLVDVARALVGWLPGGLAIASVMACMVFAAITGSSPVTLVAVGAIVFPALIESRYPENTALGLITTAGSLGCLLPPSIAMLIYAISVSGQVAVDPSDLFVAGLIPAVGIAGMLSVYGYFKGRGIPGGRSPFSLDVLMHAVRRGGWALALPLIVLGGIYSGTFTPTEAGAVALVYSVAVTVWVHKDLTLPQIGPIFAEAATLIGSIVLIVVLAFGLNDFLALIDAAGQLGAWLEGADLSPFTFLLIVNALLIVIGALMDSISATLVFAPLLAPIAFNVYGIDPIHFAIIFVVNMEIGYLAPPVATNLFVAAAIFRRPFEQVVRAIFPTLGIVCVALLVVMVVPTLSKGVLNTRAGIAFYQPFPWAGPPDQASPGEVAPPAGTGTATPAADDFCTRKPERMTLQEMGEYARRCAPTASTPAAP